MAILQRDLRASDHDREQAVAQLKAHYADGRLADAELAWRSDAAYRAVALRELEWLVSDLPARAPARRRRRPAPVLPLALLVLAIAVWLVAVPPEVTVALVLVTTVLALAATILLSPVWIPALLAFLAYRLIRARVSPR